MSSTIGSASLLTTAAVQFSRFITGALFIFSGLVKANDPVGFAVKLEDYFLVFSEWMGFFGSDFMLSITLPLAVFLVVLEVVLGVALLVGIQRKGVAFLLLALIIFFTLLTGFSAITGKVTDCGCFGDAIPLTPIESFYKDLILCVFIGCIAWDVFKGPGLIRPIFGEIPGWALTLAGTAFTFWVAITAINHLPFRDFRPYYEGANIVQGMQLPEDAKEEIVQLIWTYKNKESGEMKEFIDDLPPDLENWEFMDRDEKLLQKGDEPPIHDFFLTDVQGRDVTEEVLAIDDVHFYFIGHDIEHTNVKAWTELNDLQQAAEAEGVATFGMIGASTSEIEEFRHTAQAAYPFFTVDYKTLKTMIRTSPGVVLLKDATILKKWAWKDVPAYEDIKAEFFADRVPTELNNLGGGLMFEQGDAVADMVASGIGDYSGFTIFDVQDQDVTGSLLSDTAYWILVPDVYAVTGESWGELLPIIQQMDLEGINYLVLTGSEAETFLPMREASGIDFPYYFCDGQVIDQAAESNIVILQMEAGIVRSKATEGELRY